MCILSVANYFMICNGVLYAEVTEMLDCIINGDIFKWTYANSFFKQSQGLFVL